VLHDISLELPAGALVAVTGPIGAGKSALARALLGLYPLDSGRVLFDGRSLEQMPVAERVRRTGYLPQEPHLFSGTVRENVLLYAPGELAAEPKPTAPSMAQAMERAVRAAALGDDLRVFPAGIETEIGELGIRVSGGQRQRIGLARALAAVAPGLLVLDDPFSSVDVETEAQIIAGLREAIGPAAPARRQATILLCSHRLAAFPRADLVLVLDGGRIVEQGTHDALMRADGRYAHIYRAQQRAGESTRPATFARPELVL
jgi:ABC-type multidrug transport system fused ATPase/permease subunit